MNEEDVAGTLSEYARPLSTVDPGADRDDLDAIGSFFEGAAVVGLGEASHGTREFFQLRHRLTRYLVEERGVRRVAIEAEPGSASGVTEYVAGRSCEDPAAALEAVRAFWHTEGMASFLRWLRRFNEGRPAGDRVRCYGVDVGDPSRTASRLRSFLREAGTELDGNDPPPDVGPVLDRLADGDLPGGEDSETIEWFRRAESVADELAGWLDRRRQSESTGENDDERTSADLDLLAHLARSLSRTCEWYRSGGAAEGFSADGYERRDRMLAENVARLARERDGGVVFWAHNGHVMRGSFDDGRLWSDRPTAGECLREEFGDGYRPVGTDFHGGRFRAVDYRDGYEGYRTFAAPDPPPSAACRPLASVEGDPLLLDVRAASDDPDLDRWFDRPRAVRNLEVGYDPDGDHEFVAETDLAASFDGLVVFEETSPARGIEVGNDT